MRFPAAVLLLLVFPSGPKCAGSLHPIYTAHDAVADDGLVGTWRVVPEKKPRAASATAKDSAAHRDSAAAQDTSAADSSEAKQVSTPDVLIDISRLYDTTFRVATYLVTIGAGSQASRALGRLTRIGKTLFVDLYAYDVSMDLDDGKDFEFHFFAMLEHHKDRLVAKGINGTRLGRYVRDHPSEAAVQVLGENLIVLDSTSRVRALLLSQAKIPDAYTDSVVLERIPAIVPQ